MRVVSVVGARPQFVKLAPISKAMAEAGVDHKIVHTGQHYDVNMSDAFFSDLAIPSPDVHLGAGSGSHGVQTGKILEQMDRVLTEWKPDWVLVYGDTNSTIAGALSASKLHFKVAHLEAGLRSFNRSMPEEINRILTDHCSDLCLAPTDLSVDNLTNEGLGPRAMKVGDVMVDVCFMVRDSILEQRSMTRVEHSDEYLLATIHRADNTDDPDRLNSVIEALAGLPLKVRLAAHPRLVAKSREFDIDLGRGSVEVIAPLSYPEMIESVMDSAGVVTDSGGLQKEAFLLQTPCTTLRKETEWVETLDGGWNILDYELRKLQTCARRDVPDVDRSTPYGSGQAAREVVRVLENWNAVPFGESLH